MKGVVVAVKLDCSYLGPVSSPKGQLPWLDDSGRGLAGNERPAEAGQ